MAPRFNTGFYTTKPFVLEYGMGADYIFVRWENSEFSGHEGLASYP